MYQKEMLLLVLVTEAEMTLSELDHYVGTSLNGKLTPYQLKD
jgi:hypothetical protein